MTHPEEPMKEEEILKRLADYKRLEAETLRKYEDPPPKGMPDTDAWKCVGCRRSTIRNVCWECNLRIAKALEASKGDEG
jgi:hypothetical protein